MVRFSVRSAAFGLVGVVLASTAGFAVAAEPVHIRGAVAAVDGPRITVKGSDNRTVSLTLGDAWTLSGVVPATMSDIKPGTFIGTANRVAPDGNTALEVVVFPEALRGTGEGDRAWDLQPNSAMTNATVSNAVADVKGQTVTLTYKGGTKVVTIPPETPIVTLTPATATDLQPGAKVFVVGEPTADGRVLTRGRIAVGKNGLTPPM